MTKGERLQLERDIAQIQLDLIQKAEWNIYRAKEYRRDKKKLENDLAAKRAALMIEEKD